MTNDRKPVTSNVGSLKTELPFDPKTPLLGTQPEKTHLKRYMHPAFIAALFTIAKTWKQHKCLPADEWRKKTWYIQTMEYYSAMQRMKQCHLRETIRMGLETMILSEVNQIEKDKYHTISLIRGIQN